MHSTIVFVAVRWVCWQVSLLCTGTMIFVWICGQNIISKAMFSIYWILRYDFVCLSIHLWSQGVRDGEAFWSGLLVMVWPVFSDVEWTTIYVNWPARFYDVHQQEKWCINWFPLEPVLDIDQWQKVNHSCRCLHTHLWVPLPEVGIWWSFLQFSPCNCGNVN